MSGLFPMFSVPQGRFGALPLYRDVQMDYARGCPVWAGGAPVFVTGLEAVRGWAWRAIDTARYRFSVFSWSFGCELEALVGQPYRADTKRSEAERYVREALLVSPYIREVQVTETVLEGSAVHIAVDLTTVYGRASVHV